MPMATAATPAVIQALEEELQHSEQNLLKLVIQLSGMD